VTPAIRSLHAALALLAAFAIVFAPAPIEGSIAERLRPLETQDGRIIAPTVEEGTRALRTQQVRPTGAQRVWTVAIAVVIALVVVAMWHAALGRSSAGLRRDPLPHDPRIARGPPATLVV
jgi:hypothetical protein